MLDSNVLLDIVREPHGAVAQAFAGLDLGSVLISPVVSGEILFGMIEKPEARGNPRTLTLLQSLRIDAIESPADTIYGSLRLQLKLRGKGLSANDYWIAAHAMSRDAVLVTGDRAFHDAGIQNLKLQDWRAELAVQGRN